MLLSVCANTGLSAAIGGSFLVSPGWISLVPVLVLLVAVLITRRSLESLIMAIAAGFMLKNGFSFLKAMLDAIIGVLQTIVRRGVNPKKVVVESGGQAHH